MNPSLFIVVVDPGWGGPGGGEGVRGGVLCTRRGRWSSRSSLLLSQLNVLLVPPILVWVHRLSGDGRYVRPFSPGYPPSPRTSSSVGPDRSSTPSPPAVSSTFSVRVPAEVRTRRENGFSDWEVLPSLSKTSVVLQGYCSLWCLPADTRTRIGGLWRSGRVNINNWFVKY